MASWRARAGRPACLLEVYVAHAHIYACMHACNIYINIINDREIRMQVLWAKNNRYRSITLARYQVQGALSRALTISLAVGLSAGVAARHLSMRPCSSGHTEGRPAGSSTRLLPQPTAAMTSAADLAPAHGRCPLMSSYSTTP